MGPPRRRFDPKSRGFGDNVNERKYFGGIQAYPVFLMINFKLCCFANVTTAYTPRIGIGIFPWSHGYLRDAL